MTQLLKEHQNGNALAVDKLSPFIYSTLKELAAQQMRKERQDHTLQATALVNEAYLKLIDQDMSWNDRAHFRGVAATIMRHVLIDHARSKKSVKRGGEAQQVTLMESQLGGNDEGFDVLDLDRAISHLEEFDKRKAKVIELSFFGGLTYDEISAILNISSNTVDRDLRMGKAWLYRELLG